MNVALRRFLQHFCRLGLRVRVVRACAFWGTGVMLKLETAIRQDSGGHECRGLGFRGLGFWV